MIKKIVALLTVFTVLTCFVGCDLMNLLPPRGGDTKELSAVVPWLGEISADQVSEFVYQSSSGEPGSLGNSYYFTDSGVICEMLEALKSAKVRCAEDSEADLPGGRVESFIFITADGERHSFSTTAGYLHVVQAGTHEAFKLLNAPKIPTYKASDSTLIFVRFYDDFKVYTNTDDPRLLGEGDNFNKYEFKVYEGDASEFDEVEPRYYVECSAGILYLYSDSLFSHQEYDGAPVVFYQLCHGEGFGEYLPE